MPLTRESADILKKLDKMRVPYKKTKNGHIMVMCPNGKIVAFGGGNARGTKNTIARLKRNGIEL